jgi:hypothetical protein
VARGTAGHAILDRRAPAAVWPAAVRSRAAGWLSTRLVGDNLGGAAGDAIEAGAHVREGTYRAVYQQIAGRVQAQIVSSVQTVNTTAQPSRSRVAPAALRRRPAAGRGRVCPSTSSAS